MMKRYHEANEALRVPEELARRTVGGARPRPRPARAALLAACLCLALLGTAGAAVAVGWVRVTDSFFSQYQNDKGETISVGGVEITSDGMGYIPLERFSQESRDYAASFMSLPQYKGFASWDEAEEFLGVELADNPVLDRAEPSEFYIDSIRGKTDPYPCIVGFEGRTDSPSRIEVEASYSIGEKTDNFPGYHLFVTAMICTVQTESDEWRWRFWYKNSEEAEAETETYVTPNGLQAVIITTRHEASISSQVHFQLNGAYFYLSLSGTNGQADEAITALKEVLDGYQ